MNCVILQPSYIPWRGYFHQIDKADIFVFYDDVQYDARGWRNRNKIKTPNGTTWLTIPVCAKEIRSHATPINEVRIDWDQDWCRRHLETLRHSYKKAPYYQTYASQVAELYQQKHELLADFTIQMTIMLAGILQLSPTKFVRSSDLAVTGNKTDRLIDILRAVGADHYISGPSAINYIEADKFRAAKITLEYMTYDYPEYPQLYPPFEPKVSILDLLFMCGAESINYFR